jgi:hypothetical protein
MATLGTKPVPKYQMALRRVANADFERQIVHCGARGILAGAAGRIRYRDDDAGSAPVWRQVEYHEAKELSCPLHISIDFVNAELKAQLGSSGCSHVL